MDKLTLTPILNFSGASPHPGAPGVVERGLVPETSVPIRIPAESESGQRHLGRRLTAASAMLDLLQQHGVDRIFGIPGGPISPLYDACLDTSIDVITSQHETMAVYEAIGYAQATGRPGVVLVTSGPGILNAITGIAAAQLNEVPLLVLAGDVATGAAGRGALQDSGPTGLAIEQMLRPVTKMVDGVLHVRRALPMLEQALGVIMEHPRGAAVLRLPIDVIRHPATGAAGLESPVIQRPPELPTAMAARIAELIARAERPLLLAGVGARTGGAAEAVRRLAEAVHCPVATGLDAKGLLSEHHPLSLGVFGVGGAGDAASYLTQPVDLLLTVGARFDDTTTLNYSPLIERVPTLVQLDHDRLRLGRAFNTTVAGHCDLREALDKIREQLPDGEADIARRRRRDDNLRLVVRPITQRLEAVEGAESGRAPHNPRLVARLLDEAAGGDVVFSCDIGNHMLFVAQGVAVDHVGAFHVDLGLGGMGSGLGNAIGLALGYGARRRVVSVIGDGGLLMAGSEIATCVQNHVPLLVIVFNDGQLGMVKHGSEAVYGRSLPCTLPPLDIGSFARSLGADTARIELLADLRGALSRRLTGPLVLDVPICPDVRPGNPRDDGLDHSSRGN